MVVKYDGVVLVVLTASFGVTGYSLPRDQVGYWAVKIVIGVPDAILITGLLRGSANFARVMHVPSSSPGRKGHTTV
ncbi:hypothetical protein GOBAR_DD31224 [Gossypium barbadense]|nr:hypothetical protein GOBAR_DD31224 [Gossypium barbadense]